MGSMVFALGFALDKLLTLYMWVIIFNALISFVEPNPYNRFVILLRRLSEPALKPFRRFSRSYMYRYRIDLSPLFVILAISMVKALVLFPIIEWGRKMGSGVMGTMP